MMDQADGLTESPPLDEASIQTAPAAVAESISSAHKARSRVDSVIEQELQVIIDLKNAGDETWAEELEAFIERYPDYQLPDELIP